MLAPAECPRTVRGGEHDGPSPDALGGKLRWRVSKVKTLDRATAAFARQHDSLTIVCGAMGMIDLAACDDLLGTGCERFDDRRRGSQDVEHYDRRLGEAIAG